MYILNVISDPHSKSYLYLRHCLLTGIYCIYPCLPLIEGPKSLFTVRGSETGSVHVREATADGVSSMFAFPVSYCMRHKILND